MLAGDFTALPSYHAASSYIGPWEKTPNCPGKPSIIFSRHYVLPRTFLTFYRSLSLFRGMLFWSWVEGRGKREWGGGEKERERERKRERFKSFRDRDKENRYGQHWAPFHLSFIISFLSSKYTRLGANLPSNTFSEMAPWLPLRTWVLHELYGVKKIK